MEKTPSAAKLPVAAPITLHDALLALTAVNQDTILLDYGNIIIRRGYQDLSKVRLLSGGIAGPDLSHALFVGKGMLTAAILGESSVPTSRQILHTIKELNQGESFGIFVIVQANSDLFNFGLAVDRANVDCRTRVKVMVVNDDRSVRKERYTCGFILLMKIVGAMAERGLLFDEIYDCYEEIVRLIYTVPLNYVEEGEQKNKTFCLSGFENQVWEVIDKRSQMSLHLHHSVPTVALINISKHLDRLTELGLVKLVVEKLRQCGVCLVRIYYGNFLSVDLGTASLTVMKVFDSQIIQYLDDQCDAPGWHHVTQYQPEVTLTNEIPGLLKHHGKQQIPLKGAKLGEIERTIFMRAVQFACDALISCERQLNTIDAETSDGNVGTRLKNMSENVNQRLNNKTLPTDCPYHFFKKLSIIAESSIGGIMGSVYGVFFEKIADVFGELPEGDYIIPFFIWGRALTVGGHAIRELCRTVEQAERTMCYPIKCSQIAINEEMQKNQNHMRCYEIGVIVAEEAAQRTKVPSRKYPDAGAHAVGIWMRAILEAVKLMSTPVIE